MKSISIIFLGLCVVVIVISQPPPPGFLLVPFNNTNYLPLPPSGQFSPCLYSNAPEPYSNSFYIGCAKSFDRLLCYQVFEKSASWFRGREKIFSCPENGGGTANITAIRCTDRTLNRKSYAHIVSGGIGQAFVTIKLGSPRSYAFAFECRVFGH